MPVPVFERLSGVTNGTNTVFETSRSYLAGSVRVFRNGIVNSATGVDGYAELGNRRVKMNEPPKPTDIMQAYYIPT